jgi:transglutaminase-like putative cysteine protease
MDRRRFLLGAATAPIIGASGKFVAAHGGEEARAGWRRFEVTTEVALADGPAVLWLPLAQTARSYQRALSLAWHGNDDEAELVGDAVYGAPVLRLAWSKQTSPRRVSVVQTVETRDRDTRPDPAAPAELALFLEPTASMPTGGIVRRKAEQIIVGKQEPRERARAIYDWVVDNTFRDPATRGCGLGNIANMLETGYLGGKCADISSLMVGLCRAAGIPAREIYGVRVADSRQFKSLGRSGDVTKAQHCRAEIYLEPQGWMPVDPADVRKVVLEEKLPVDAEPVRALRERLFGSWEMNWVGFNSARDFSPAGVPHPLEFLMYPFAVTATGEPDWLDPDSFRYHISAREI